MEEYDEKETMNKQESPESIDIKQWKRWKHLLTGSNKQLLSLRKKFRKPHIFTSIYDNKVTKAKRHSVTDLHKAAQTGDIIALKRLIKRGINVNKPTGSDQGHTPPLLYAATNGHVDCAKTLLVSGANVNGCDDWNNTALLKAVCHQRTGCIRALLNHGADVHKPNKWGALPLQYAALQGYDDVTEILIEYGARVSEVSSSILPPPLIGAATQCHIKVLDVLLRHTYESRQLNSALTLALYHFLCACAEFVEQTKQVSITDRYKCVEVLISHGATVTSEHLQMCCYHYFIPVLNIQCYVRMLTFLVKISNFIPGSSAWNEAFMVLFGHVTCLGPHKWQLLKVICSVGFTPSQDLLDTLRFTLTDSEYESLCKLRSHPRSLTDLSRQAYRRTATSNVQQLVQGTEIPQTLQDIVFCHNKYFSAL